jgi:hypothetical protein
MSLTKLFTDYALKLHAKTAQTGGAVYIDGIQSQGINVDHAVRVEGADGAVYNTFGSLVSGAPIGRFVSNDLKTVLDACGLTGMLIDADGTHPGVVQYFDRYVPGGTRGVAGQALSCTVASGLMTLVSLELAHRGTATVTGQFHGCSATGVAPIAWNEADSVPAAAYPAVSAAWTLGKIMFNSEVLVGAQRVGVDFGVGIISEARDSDIYPSVISIQRIQPIITIVGAEIEDTSWLTEDGIGYAASQVIFYARKKAEYGTFTANETAEHIKFTLGKCRIGIGGIEGDPKQITVRVTPWYTAGVSPVAPISINTASAIT